jgi:hypothetical protein
MPIRFSCPHCTQKLSVSTRKAGKAANCPRCKKELTVPSPEPAAVPSDSAEVATAEEGENEDDPYSQFVVYDETELVYDDAAPVSHPGGVPSAHDRVAVPRYVLYTQGLLLGAVALTCFIFGVLTGGTFFSAPSKTAKGPCTLTGTVRYASGNQKLPDDGAVIIVLPDTKDAGQRASSAGMRPDQPLPETPLVGVQQIRDMGGAYTRAGPQGDFSVNLASGGKYFVLVLSSHAHRTGNEEVKVMDVRTLGRFFDGAIDLLADSKYQLTSETVRGDRNLTAQFD